MKLDAREEFYEVDFKVEFLELNTENPNEVLVLIEKELRDRFNPIIGRQ